MMRGVIAVAVLSVGLGLAAQFYAPGWFDALDVPLPLASSTANAAPAADLSPDTGRVTDFSPGSSLKPVRDGWSWRDLVRSDEELRLASYSNRFAAALEEQTSLPPHASTNSVEAPSWRSAVLVAATGLGPNGTQVSSRYLSPEQRLNLVTALQIELRRVGCFGGDASGSWNRETQDAVAQFMDRVNAVLPLDEPDFTLLELVKAHSRSTCDASCPEGQGFDAHGRCIPLAVLAQSRKPRLSVADASAPAARTPTVKPSRPESDPAAQKPTPFPAPMGLGASALGTGGTPAAGSASPTYRVATADDAFLSAPTGPVTDAPVAAAPTKSKPRKVASQGPRRVSNYRHVQHLFEHPLGRL